MKPLIYKYVDDSISTLRTLLTNLFNSHLNNTTAHPSPEDIIRWEEKSDLALGETSLTAYQGDRGKTAYDHSQITHAPSDAPSASVFNSHVSDSVKHITSTERTTWDAKSNLALGLTSLTAYRGDRGKIAYDHSQLTHASSDAPSASVFNSHTSDMVKHITGEERTTWNNTEALVISLEDKIKTKSIGFVNLSSSKLSDKIDDLGGYSDILNVTIAGNIKNTPVFPIRVGAGLFDFSLDKGKPTWYFEDGSILRTLKVTKTLSVEQTVYLTEENDFSDTLTVFSDNASTANYLGLLSDLPGINYSLRTVNSPNI